MAIRYLNIALAGALLLLLALSFLAGRCSMPDPLPVLARVDTVTVEVLTEREPVVEEGRLGRVLRPAQQPRAVEVAPGGAAPDVAAFLDAALASRREDSAVVHPSGVPPPRRVLVRSGAVAPRRLDLWAVVSDGTLRHETYPCREDCTFRVSGDSLVVRAARFWWLDDAVACLALGAAGYAVDGLRGASLAGGGCTLGQFVH